MSNPTAFDLLLSDAAFAAAFTEHFVALKQNYDAAGNLVGTLPASAIASGMTAEYGNLLDDFLLAMRSRVRLAFRSITEDGAVLDGVTSDEAAIDASIVAVAALGGGVVLLPQGSIVHGTPTLDSTVRLFHICVGTPEGARYGTDGDLAFRCDGSSPLWIKTGTGLTGWAVLGAAAATTWTERYLGDFITASDVDLATGTNPSVTVTNDTTTAGQVASCVWRGNEGDADAQTAMATVGAFATDASGLTLTGSNNNANFTETTHQAPHVFATWTQLLGEAPRAGVEYCVQIYVASNTISAASQYVGIGSYTENDGTIPVDIVGSSAKLDEKRIVAAIGQFAAVPGAAIYEGSSASVSIGGSRLPSGYNCVALIFRSGVMVEGALGVYAGGAFPRVEDMQKIDTWIAAQPFDTAPYLDDFDRLAIVFQQQSGAQFNASVPAVRVLSRGGAT